MTVPGGEASPVGPNGFVIASSKNRQVGPMLHE
jgi:hypothetical protein